jgi:hypothetical protein
VDIQKKDGYLYMENLSPVGIDNENIFSFDGCRAKIAIKDLKSIKTALNFLSESGMGSAEVVVSKAEVVFLIEDDDTGELTETTYVRDEYHSEPVSDCALGFRLGVDIEGLLVSVIAYPKWSDGHFFSILGVIHNETFGWENP